MRVLIAESNPGMAREVEGMINQRGHYADVCYTGKDCQRRLYHQTYDVLVLDHDIKDHTAAEVIRYACKRTDKMSIVLVVNNTYGKSYEVAIATNRPIEIMEKPYTVEKISSQVLHDKFSVWKNYLGKVSTHDYGSQEELEEQEGGFTAIELNHFIAGKVNPVDYYIRLSANKFLKILCAEDFFDQGRLDNFITEKKLTHLYIKNVDRGVYLNFMNDYLKNGAKDRPELRLELTKLTAQKFLEDAFDLGLSHELAQESATLCENVYCAVMGEEKLFELLNSLRIQDESEFQRWFMTAFICALMSRRIDWMTPRTTNYLIMGALLQDIGLTQLPPEVRNIRECNTPQKLKKHLMHCSLGASILDSIQSIPDPVVALVYHHHERGDGTGGPSGVELSRIFPLAKILGLACDFYDHMVKQQLTPMEALQDFIPLYGTSGKYDPIMVKALIRSFIRDEAQAG